jgi:hypothetical protein
VSIETVGFGQEWMKDFVQARFAWLFCRFLTIVCSKTVLIDFTSSFELPQSIRSLPVNTLRTIGHALDVMTAQY